MSLLCVAKCEGIYRNQPCEPNSALERRLDRGHWLSVKLDKVLGLWIDPVPSPQVRKQAEGIGTVGCRLLVFALPCFRR